MRWLMPMLVAGTFGALTWFEVHRPLRRQTESKLRREARNFSVAGLGAVAIQLCLAPVIHPLTTQVAERRLGLIPHLAVPRSLQVIAALLLMDYTYYIWHVLMHKVPLLWRFHLVHHVDLDLDASTALRFHFGELFLTIPLQAVQVTLIGLDPQLYSIWQMAFIVAIMFHHSAVRLPIAFERCLCTVLVTPRMHGIHHSVVDDEVNSNWSSGLNVWDRLHGTLRLNVSQDRITIGVPGYLQPESVTLGKILALPFLSRK
jgi:sterol desaturase/sphingolipid hydroxylase (fatty acid hydroxylase superfamily)